MGLLDLIKKQFIDVIEWTEGENGVLAYRYPMEDQEIQNGAQLTVRDTQLALFVNEGQLADLFKPGKYTLNTNTLPVLTSLQNWDKLFQSPFKSDIYFFSTREQIDQKWGTPTPITLRDKELGPVRLKANGAYSYKLDDPKVFYKKISGTREKYQSQELEGQLRSMIITAMASHFGSTPISFVDMAGNQMKFSETLKTILAPSFIEYGLELRSFYVQSLTLPEELLGYLDKVASMKIVGDLKQYTQFQVADSISMAAKNEGGAAGAGVGLGAGVAIGQTMANAFGTQQAASDPDPMATINKLHDLLTKGAITQVEFDQKKSELLKKII